MHLPQVHKDRNLAFAKLNYLKIKKERTKERTKNIYQSS